MHWKFISKEQTLRVWHVYWRCKLCGFRCVNGGNTPPPCVCCTSKR